MPDLTKIVDFISVLFFDPVELPWLLLLLAVISMLLVSYIIALGTAAIYLKFAGRELMVTTSRVRLGFTWGWTIVAALLFFYTMGLFALRRVPSLLAGLPHLSAIIISVLIAGYLRWRLRKKVVLVRTHVQGGQV